MDRIELAKQIIFAAGKKISRSYGAVHTLTEKSANDYVSEVDLAVEKYMRAEIIKHFPDDSILGEEIDPQTGTTAYQWIFDPIDGTNNFVRKIPLFVVQLALRYQGKTILGMIYDPLEQVLYRAELGKGAYRDDIRKGTSVRMHTNSHALSRSMMTLTSTFLKGRPKLLDILHKLEGRIADIRIWGTAALSYCHIASGQTDFYFSMKQKPWDVYPGKLIVEEAGGFVVEFNGNEWTEESNTSILICTPGNHKELLELVQSWS